MNNMSEEIKKEYYHEFECCKCKLKFSFSSEESDINKFSKLMDGIKCPKCGDVWGVGGAEIIHVMNVPTTVASRKSRGKENLDRSREAHAQAARYRQEVGSPEMVDVSRRSSMGAPSRYGGAVEKVPKSVIESLEKQAMPDNIN
jgi:hypothetical protein